MGDEPKNQYIHEEISFIGANLQSTMVTEKVCTLVNLGYKVKVVEHNPQYFPSSNLTAYQTTIMATLTDAVNISN